MARLMLPKEEYFNIIDRYTRASYNKEDDGLFYVQDHAIRNIYENNRDPRVARSLSVNDIIYTFLPDKTFTIGNYVINRTVRTSLIDGYYSTYEIRVSYKFTRINSDEPAKIYAATTFKSSNDKSTRDVIKTCSEYEEFIRDLIIRNPIRLESLLPKIPIDAYRRNDVLCEIGLSICDELISTLRKMVLRSIPYKYPSLIRHWVIRYEKLRDKRHYMIKIKLDRRLPLPRNHVNMKYIENTIEFYNCSIYKVDLFDLVYISQDEIDALISTIHQKILKVIKKVERKFKELNDNTLYLIDTELRVEQERLDDIKKRYEELSSQIEQIESRSILGNKMKRVLLADISQRIETQDDYNLFTVNQISKYLWNQILAIDHFIIDLEDKRFDVTYDLMTSNFPCEMSIHEGITKSVLYLTIAIRPIFVDRIDCGYCYGETVIISITPKSIDEVIRMLDNLPSVTNIEYLYHHTGNEFKKVWREYYDSWSSKYTLMYDLSINRTTV